MKKMQSNASRKPRILWQLKLWQKILGWFFGVIFGAYTLFWAYYGHLQKEFSELIQLVDDTADKNEILYLDCRDKNTNEIGSHLDELRNSLIELVDKHKYMGHLIDLKTYCAIHEFTVYTDKVQKSDTNICSLPLIIKSPDDIKQWKNSIDKKITDNRLTYWRTLKSAFSLLQGDSYKPYSPNKCK